MNRPQSTAEARRILDDLPEKLLVQNDAVDGWTWVIYEEHLIATWDPEFGEATVRVHLFNDEYGRLGIDTEYLFHGVKRLQELGYCVDFTHAAPLGDGRWMEIVNFYGIDVPAESMERAIRWTLWLSENAIDRRKL